MNRRRRTPGDVIREARTLRFQECVVIGIDDRGAIVVRSTFQNGDTAGILETVLDSYGQRKALADLRRSCGRQSGPVRVAP
jgi:hypothetical protein